MNVIGFSGLANSISFKRREFAGLTERELNIAQGLDAAACLAADGGIVAAAAEERFTRQKATGAFPLNALRFCLAAGNLNPEDVDIVAHGFDYEPHRGQFQRDDFSRRQFDEVFSAEAQRRLLREHFEAGRWGEKLVRVPHHLAHAASAFYLSGFERSLVLVSDGMGEVESLTVAVGEGKDLKILTTIPAFHSLGALYGVFTLYLGFYMNSDEYKVMGLAPYGSPRRFFDSLMGCVSLKPDGTYTIPIFSHNQTLEEQETHRGVLRFLADRFGPAREPESEITQTHKDLAAALQAVTQACQIHVLRHFKRETGQKNLCLAGGVALNCSANGVIKRSELFDRVFVQPAAGDDGCAMGAALYAQRLHSSRFQPRRMTTPLWGPQFSRAEILEALDTRGDCEFRELSSFEEVCSETARRLQGGEIVAWFQGRMEFGPRALGSRSILADPRDATMRDRINALVKKREGFRPFAPVVTREAAASIFDIPPGQEAEYAHMLFVTHVKPEFRAKLPATTHVDGSARVQTVSREENERLWDLLNQFGAETGMPVLLNTSFNVRGQPIVCNPSEAIETFIRAGLDVLVIGDFVVTRGNKAAKGDESETEAAAERGRLRECAERYEEFWVNRLLSMEPASLPLKRNERAESNQSKRRRTPFLLEEAAGTHGWRSEELFAGFLLWLSRVSGMENFDLAYSSSRMRRAVAADGELSRSVPFHVGFDLRQGLEPAFASVRAELAKISERGTWFRDAGSRHPELKAIGEGELKLPVGVFVSDAKADGAPGLETEITFILAPEAKDCRLEYEDGLFDSAAVDAIPRQILALIEQARLAPERPVSEAPTMASAELRRVLIEWNATRRDDVPDVCLHELFAEQARKTPNAIALAFQDRELTYAELDARAAQVAARLQSLGVAPDTLVAVCARVSPEMMIGLLGVLKAGGAYVPLDPDYPAERIAFMLEDSGAPVLLTQDGLWEKFPVGAAQVVSLDSFNFGEGETSPAHLASFKQSPSSLAYVIYTSGSTGKPKGVMVTHRNVVNFCLGMDERVGACEKGVWLSVTSISFDISVLELFWTLTRGFKVVLHDKNSIRVASRSISAEDRKHVPEISLFYFASDESAAGSEKYNLLLEGARFADEQGFSAVWTPERHFHPFGGLYPNPSVTSAAIAAITKRVAIRAGSVVAPLHDPIRVVEEWSLVDNISNGRVGISFASGWQVNDFALAPANYSNRKEIMLESIERIQKLWRGEPFDFQTPRGATARLRVLPRPIQSELPIWVTASGNPETFVLAGKLGANVLTHLLGQNPRELKEKIGAYREARRAAGHQGPGHVTLMLHTFVGETVEAAREIVRAPFTNYLRSSIDLIKNDPEAFSTFKPAASAKGTTAGPSRAWTEDERDAIAAHAFDRYFDTSGLFGNPFDCARKIEQFARMGVDEVACLIDFGVPEAEALAGLERLNKARKLVSETGGQSRNAHPAALEMRRHGVTHLQCTPSMAAMLLEDPAATESVAALKKLLLGGEALPLALLKKLPAAGQVLNMYGPTETTIWSATDTLDTTAERVTIGRPIANTQIYIVDKWLQPLPPGLPGELLIGGEGVVRGYLHRPDLTAEKFIPNSFDPTGSSRLYRTGDLARYLPDGRIEFLGRLDHQVKLRGFRIELGEVEAVVCRHDSARECVAIVREDTPGDKRLVAYLVPSGATKPDVAALRAHCRASLPEYMVPSAFVSLHSLPLTPNGKVDRKALPAPVVAGATAPRASDALSIAEQKIARVYRELLGVETVRREDNFFELGGNSVLATQLITRLREVFGSDLPLRLAFEHPRVESLATAVDSAAAPQHHESGPREIRAIERNGPLPLSFAQQRIWFLHQLEPGSHYNDHFDLRLGGPLRIAELERAINEIIRRHETLRSTFHKGEAGPVLRILPEVRLKLDVIDFSALPAEIREQQAIQAAVSDCQQPFDLETGPLLRASLVKLAGEDHLLVLTFDHIVIDGWSHGVFLSELTALYEAFVSGRPSPLSALTAQYTDFAAWQQSWFKGANIENHLAYWRAQLKGAPPLLELPTDHPRPAAESFHGARHFLHLDRALVDGLSGVARRERCTLFMVFLAAFQTLLGKYAETEDVIVGSPIANRNRAETEPLIGPFMNTLALRGDLRGDPSFGELLSRARKTCLDAYAHQDLPFEQLVADLQPPRNPSHSPVFQVMFILQNTPMPPAKAGNLSFRHFDVDAGTSKLDLTLNLEETPEGAVGWIEYATALFEPASIAAMARHFTELLRGIAANSGERLSQLRLAPEGQEWKFPCGGVPRRGGVALVGTPAPAIRGELIPEPEKVLDGASFTAVQREMIGIWRDVLGVAEISLEDNLFDLGGHSLLITRIISRIRKTLGVELAIHVFFETPTVAGVAAAVEAELAHPEPQSARAMGIPKLARA